MQAKLSPASFTTVQAACLIVIAVCASSEASDGQLNLEPIPNPEHSIHLISPAAKSTWRLRIPERVLADPAIILIDHAGAPVTWSRLQGGGLASSYAMDGDAPAGARIGFRVTIEPAPTGLALAFTIANKTSETLKNVAGHICLSHDHGTETGAETFADPAYNRSYLITADDLRSLDTIDRGGPPNKIRSHYLLQGASPISFFLTQTFWGQLSKTAAVEPWIAGVSASGNWTVAIWWERAVELFQNSDQSNRCIHANPAYGDLAPGQAVTVRGGIDLVRGVPRDAYRVYQQRRQQRSGQSNPLK